MKWNIFIIGIKLAYEDDYKFISICSFIFTTGYEIIKYST